MAEIVLTKDNFKSEVMESSMPVLVDFWATWCAPCRMLSPFISEIAEDYEGEVKVGKVNVDEQPELAAAFGVQSIPMVLVFRDGKVSGMSIGYKPKSEIEAMLK